MTDLPINDRNEESDGSCLRIQITTGARLHFGLIDTVAPFGGVGLMIDRPGTEITVTPSVKFQCDSEFSERLLPIAKRISHLAMLPDLPPCKVSVTQRPDPHSGLGSGTQLDLSAAEAMCFAIGIRVQATELATQLAARGRRSAVGVHGYFDGGLIFERGDVAHELNSVCARVELPANWHVVVMRPTSDVTQVSGDFEAEQFASLPAVAESEREHLACLAGEITDAAETRDFDSFCRAVRQYNHRSGLLFQRVQNGPYNGDEVTRLIESLCERGARGVGQSSWGPGVFAWFDSQQSARTFVQTLPATIKTIAVAEPMNQGRSIEMV